MPNPAPPPPPLPAPRAAVSFARMLVLAQRRFSRQQHGRGAALPA